PAAGQPAGGDASAAPAAGGAAPAAAGAAAAPAATVDVAALLNDLASKASQPLNWKTSIVDLMKLLDLD
ncbi:DUF3597 family protein, partial [Klebsiella pneumoniae]|uniref:DUF3597 family protein n=1 Tax=Klebsiella pneumoniae TaxID=573 RepID=UPI0013D13A88